MDDIIGPLRRRGRTVACSLAVAVASTSAASAQSGTSLSAARAAAAVSPQTRPASEGDHDQDMTASGPELRIRGFGDVEFRATTARDEPNTFTIGQLDLFATSRLADDLNFLSEIVFEAGDDNAATVDVERVLLQFSPSDYLTVGAGRFHQTIGYYNTAYHHGSWFETATGRPRVFEFEDDGGILPIHGVGVFLRGLIPSGSLGLRYVVEIANGRASRADVEPVQIVRDENDRKSVNVALMARPARFPGLQAGLSIFRDRLTPGEAPIDQTILAAHIVYQGAGVEQLNEALFIRNARPNSDGGATTSSFYSQLSRAFGRFRPYVRYEILRAPADDPLYSAVGRFSGAMAGLRYDFRNYAALKVQYERSARRGEQTSNGFVSQLAFTF